VIDADMLIRFPELGHTTRLQIEGADILLLNKIDLIEPAQIEPLETAENQSDRGNCSHRALQH
jgi:G3E family GTPase